MVKTIAPPRRKLIWARRQSPASHVPADHGCVAAAPGSACVPWNFGAANKSVACMVTDYNPDSPASVSRETMFVLAVSGTTIYGGGESCEKPFACRLTKDSYVVTWERQATAAANARIEAARIFKGENGQWQVDQSTLGSIGWPLDTTVDPGESDANCRSVYVEEGVFAISYASETANAVVVAHERTYSKRFQVMPWTTTGNPVAGAISKNYAAQHWDDDNGTPTVSGGYMLSTIALTNRRDFIVAWENRDWDGANYINSIQYRILAGMYHATPFATELETGTIKLHTGSAANDLLALRRPHIATQHPDIFGSSLNSDLGGEEILCLYGLEDVDGPVNSFPVLDTMTAYAGAALQHKIHDWDANTGLNAARAKVGSASVIMGRTIRAGIAVLDYDSEAGRTLVLQHTCGASELLAMSVAWPDRPFPAIVPVDDKKEHLLISFDGFNDAGGDAERWLALYELQAA